jgi:hypothetical protein
MSKSENFVSRWSRLKREARAEMQPEPTGSPPAFDPTSLPPVESIVASTDIRPFLRSGVPEELTRAALRGAWVADPAIRDFIGIAENQWDFNDPTAIPGFAPLEGIGDQRGLVAHALGSSGNASEAIAGKSGLAERSVLAAIVPRRGEPVDKVWLSSATPTDSLPRVDLGVDMADRAKATSRVNLPVQHDPATDKDRRVGHRRSHGSALPKCSHGSALPKCSHGSALPKSV